MTDLVVSVRLKAEGGIAGQLRQDQAAVEGLGQASAAASGQARTLASGTTEAAGAARDQANASNQASAAVGQMAAAQRQAAAALSSITNESSSFENQVARLRAQLDPLGEAQRQAARDLELAETAYQRGAIGADLLGAAQKRMEQASRGVAVSFGQQRVAGMMIGQQFQDIGIQASMNTDPLRIMSMQGGQLATAFDMLGMKGAGGRLASFFAGPYGAAVLTAIALGGPFVAHLFAMGNELEEVRSNLDEAAKSADSFGTAQALLGKIIDLNTGKFKSQNLVLRETIRLQAEASLLTAKDEERKARAAIGKIGGNSVSQTLGIVGAGGVGQRGELNAARSIGQARDAAAKAEATNAPLAKLRDEILVGGLTDVTEIRKRVDTMAKAGQLASYSAAQIIDLKRQLFTLPQSLNDQKAAQQTIDAIDGKGIADPLKPYKAPDKPKKAPSTVARDEFGRDAQDRIASITESFDDTPAAVRQADRAIRGLDDLIDDLGRKKPVNFAELIQGAEAAKVTVREGLIRTIADAFEAPKTLGDKAAEALGQIDTVIAQLGKEKPAGFEALIANAERARGVIEDGLARPYNDFVQAQSDQLQIQRLVNAGRDDEAEAQRTILALEKQMGPLSQTRKDAILASVQALKAEQREVDVLRQKQQVYLNALADARSLIVSTIEGGINGIEALPERLLATFKRFMAEWLTENIFGSTFRKLEDQVKGTNVVQAASDRMVVAVDGVSKSIDAFAAKLDDFVAGRAGGAANPEQIVGDVKSSLADLKSTLTNEIVVRGKLPSDEKTGGLGSPRQFVRDMVTQLAEKVGIDEATAKKIGQGIAGGLEGAFYGQLASGVVSLLGVKQNSTGASIGGALGGAAATEFLGSALGKFAGPLGGIAGGILGGLIGGLFEKPKYGTSLVSSVDNAQSAGSNRQLGNAAGDLAGQVQSGVRQIADQLGGVLGAFDLAIGTFDGKYRVRTTTSGWDGKGALDYNGNSGRNLVDFGDDEAGAISFAIMDAIKDGAVKGLSQAVQAALRSSTDINDALQEALDVASLEKALGGVGAELKATFDQFDKTAADRVDLAKKYGLDLLAVEKLNAEQRADLLDQTLKSRVASLQDVLDNIKFGDLFEGSAADRRKAIQGEIADAQQDAEAGVDGAADRLAALERQLVEVSREGFGTAGPEYATDRDSAISNIEKVIQAEQDRVNTAAGVQAAQTKAIQDGNALASEANDQLAIANARLDRIAGALEGVGGSAGGSVIDYIKLNAREPF